MKGVYTTLQWPEDINQGDISRMALLEMAMAPSPDAHSRMALPGGFMSSFLYIFLCHWATVG